MSNLRLLIKGLSGCRTYSSVSILSRRLRGCPLPGEVESTNVCLRNGLSGDSELNQWNQFLNCSPSIFHQKRFYSKRGIVKEKKGKSVKYEMSDEELSKVIPVEEFEAYLNAVHVKLRSEFSTQLSLRAGFGVETIPVELDGSTYPLKELAQISKKSANLMVLNLTSLPDALKPILTALNASGMNLSPQQDGLKIFLTLPKVTREHRENLAKSAKNFFNSAKLEINRLQNQYTEMAKTPRPGISQETIRDATENVRFRSQEMIRKCEEMLKSKTKEILDD